MPHGASVGVGVCTRVSLVRGVVKGPVELMPDDGDPATCYP